MVDWLTASWGWSQDARCSFLGCECMPAWSKGSRISPFPDPSQKTSILKPGRRVRTPWLIYLINCAQSTGCLLIFRQIFNLPDCAKKEQTFHTLVTYQNFHFFNTLYSAKGSFHGTVFIEFNIHLRNTEYTEILVLLSSYCMVHNYITYYMTVSNQQAIFT